MAKRSLENRIKQLEAEKAELLNHISQLIFCIDVHSRSEVIRHHSSYKQLSKLIKSK